MKMFNCPFDFPNTKYVLTALFLMLLATANGWSKPVITNVSAQQQVHNRLVDISYDLTAAVGETITVRIEAKTPESDWLPITSVSGDVGPAIIPGIGKTVIWAAANDFAATNFAEVKIRIIADSVRDWELTALTPVRTIPPSIVTVAVSVVTNDENKTPVEGLTVEDFVALENGLPLTSESFLSVEPIAAIPYTTYTVLMLDVSSSISLTNLARIKETAKNFVRDPLTGASRLLPNQLISVCTFDETNRINIDFSSDVDALSLAIDSITRGVASTDLYGAIVNGASKWDNLFDLDKVETGALILVTDGNDTAGLSTLQEATDALVDKTFFAVPVGDQVDLTALEAIAGTNGVVLPTEAYEQLSATFEVIRDEVLRTPLGKYIFYYATPRRTGTNDVEFSAIDNLNVTGTAVVLGSIEATNFSSVLPEVIIRGPAAVYAGETVQWDVITRWSNDPADYSWAESPLGILNLTTTNAGAKATLAGLESATGIVTVTVTDLNWNANAQRDIAVLSSRIPTGLLAAANDGQILLTWNDLVHTVGNYNVYWSTSPGVDTNSTLQQVENASDYTFTELTNGAVYYFRISAVINGDEGPLSNEVSAQPIASPEIAWEKLFDRNGAADNVTTVQPTDDGGYILGGFSLSDTNGNRDYWVVKVDADGNEQWNAAFGGNEHDDLSSLQQTTDGGYILGGTSLSGTSDNKSSFNFGTNDFWIVKIDNAGNKQWERSFGGNQSDLLQSLQETSDGGYILGGSSNSGATGNKSSSSLGGYDYWIVKVDASGNKEWEKSFGGGGSDQLFKLQQTSEEGYILGGYSLSGISTNKLSAAFGSADYWVVKVDGEGNKQWEQSFGGNGNDQLRSLQQTSDGGYIFGGYSNSDISGNKTSAPFGFSDYWIVKVDADGLKEWERTFGGSENDELRSLQQTVDGGYILGGWSLSSASGNKIETGLGSTDQWILKLDTEGILEWSRSFGGADFDQLQSLRQTEDGGYILGGWSRSDLTSDDFWVMKLGYPTP